MDVLGLITARAASKGIPGKNLVRLLGRPLLEYTCNAARASTALSRVVLSTDGEEIAAVGRTAGIEVPFLRPVQLAQDDTPSIAVAVHALEWLQAHEGWMPDALVLLQPTSPLRTARHIDEAVRLLQSGVDTVVSVIDVPHRFNPYSIMEIQDGRLVPYIAGPVPFNRFRRQDLPTYVARNGPAVLVSRCDVVLGRGSFYGDRVCPYRMSSLDSLDIDEEFDLMAAAAALEYRSRHGDGA